MRYGRRSLVGLVAVMAMSLLTGCLANGPWVFRITDPSDSYELGRVTVLSSGLVVVTDPKWAPAGTSERGAVFVYDGATHVVLTKLIGATDGDQVGSGDVVELSNGNFVVLSPHWHNGVQADAGAATWMNGATGAAIGSSVNLDGVGVYTVGATNSLVGAATGDEVGFAALALAETGNYVVLSRFATKGAVSWGNGVSGTAGVVSAANSLVGATAGDTVGEPYELPDGNVLIGSSQFDVPGGVDAGALTWMSGTGPTAGVVSAANSLVGANANDFVGGGDIRVLTNGNWITSVPFFGADDRGAVVWGSAAAPPTGAVSAANAFVGAQANDGVGRHIAALTDGNYVVASPDADLDGHTDNGAVTWADGGTGLIGVLSAASSLVGGSDGDHVGSDGLAVTPGGSYVVASAAWSSTRGAATWRAGGGPNPGVVDATNSLVGSTPGNAVGGRGVAVLANGNYVVGSPSWNSGRGAATWGRGTRGVVGTVSTSNSITGSSAASRVGDRVMALTNGNYVVLGAESASFARGTRATHFVVTAANSLMGLPFPDSVALPNGNYVVYSLTWDNPVTAAVDAGAATWGSGTKGVKGVVSAANSLVGTTANDHVGADVRVLANGNAVVISDGWNKGLVTDAGAVTWMSGTKGRTGVVSAANSLVGTSVGDQIGSGGIVALAGGDYEVVSPQWSNNGGGDPKFAAAGAATYADGRLGTVGEVAASNSVLGLSDGAGPSTVVGTRLTGIQMVVGQYAANTLAFFDPKPTDPRDVYASRVGSSASVFWTAPDSVSPFPVTYTVTATPGGRTCTTTTLTCTVRGLRSATEYVFTVVASNRVGTGPTSAPALVARGATLASGKSLGLGSYLASADGRTMLLLKHVGGLSLYVNGIETDLSGTGDGDGVVRMRMGADGNLALLRADDSIVWSSSIGTPVAGSSLVVLDGSAVIRKGSTTSWTQGTTPNGLVRQGARLRARATLPAGKFLRSPNKQCGLGLIDGNLVLWGPGGVIRYQTDTAGSGAVAVTLLANGDLQLVKGDASVAYDFATAGSGLVLEVTNECRLRLGTRSTTVLSRP